MESLLNSIEQSDSDHDSDEDEASMEIELQAPRAKSSSRKRQTNTKRRPVSLLDVNCGSQVYVYIINFISNLCRLLRELFLKRRDVNVKTTGLQRSSLTC